MPSKILTLIFCFALAVFPLLAMAAAGATTPANGVAASGSGGSGDSNDFFGWISFLYGFMLSAAAVLAVLMLVIAGVEMMTAVEKWRTDAKQRIWNALAGLLLAALSVLILKTINPMLTEFKIQLEGIPATNSNLKQAPGAKSTPTDNCIKNPQTGNPTTGSGWCSRVSNSGSISCRFVTSKNLCGAGVGDYSLEMPTACRCK